jgi:hypothetical protein
MYLRPETAEYKKLDRCVVDQQRSTLSPTEIEEVGEWVADR